MNQFGLKKSARKILLVLSSSNSKLTQKEIQFFTGLSIRCIKSSLSFLKKSGFIDELIDFSDMRRKTYILGGESNENNRFLRKT